MTKEILTNATADVSFISSLNEGQVALGFSDGLIEVWNSKNQPNYKLTKRLLGHSSKISSINQLINGLTASTSVSGEIMIWNATTHNNNSNVVAIKSLISLDNTYSLAELQMSLLASSCFDATGVKIYLWNISDDSLTPSIITTNNTAAISAMIKVNNKFFVTGSYDATIQVWNVTGFINETQLTAIINCPCPVSTLLHIAGYKIAAAGSDHNIYIYNIISQNLVLTLTGHTYLVYSLINLVGHVTDERLFIASASLDGTIKVWGSASVFNTANLVDNMYEVSGYNGTVPIISKTYSESRIAQLINNNIASAKDSYVRIWNFTHFEIRTTTKTITTRLVEGAFVFIN